MLHCKKVLSFEKHMKKLRKWEGCLWSILKNNNTKYPSSYSSTPSLFSTFCSMSQEVESCWLHHLGFLPTGFYLVGYSQWGTTEKLRSLFPLLDSDGLCLCPLGTTVSAQQGSHCYQDTTHYFFPLFFWEMNINFLMLLVSGCLLFSTPTHTSESNLSIRIP